MSASEKMALLHQVMPPNTGSTDGPLYQNQHRHTAAQPRTRDQSLSHVNNDTNLSAAQLESDMRRQLNMASGDQPAYQARPRPARSRPQQQERVSHSGTSSSARPHNSPQASSSTVAPTPKFGRSLQISRQAPEPAPAAAINKQHVQFEAMMERSDGTEGLVNFGKKTKPMQDSSKIDETQKGIGRQNAKNKYQGGMGMLSDYKMPNNNVWKDESRATDQGGDRINNNYMRTDDQIDRYKKLSSNETRQATGEAAYLEHQVHAEYELDDAQLAKYEALPEEKRDAFLAKHVPGYQPVEV